MILYEGNGVQVLFCSFVYGSMFKSIIQFIVFWGCVFKCNVFYIGELGNINFLDLRKLKDKINQLICYYESRVVFMMMESVLKIYII